jgi:hypothetical protein
VEERLSALGNVIACNDYVALVHPDIDRVSAVTKDAPCGLTVFLYRKPKKSLLTPFKLKYSDKPWRIMSSWVPIVL